MLQVILRRTKQKQYEVKYETGRSWTSAIGFLYLRNAADRELGSPALLKVTLENAEKSDAATDVAASEEHQNGAHS